MTQFPTNLEQRLVEHPFPFKITIELVQSSNTLEVRFLDQKAETKCASTMLEIWEGQLYTFKEFFGFMKPYLPEYIVTDLFVRPDLRRHGFGLFILRTMASLMNAASFGLFHVNSPFASFWIHVGSILATDVSDLQPWLENLPNRWQKANSILYYLENEEVRSYGRITHGLWFSSDPSELSFKIDVDRIIDSRNLVSVIQRGQTALIASSRWLHDKLNLTKDPKGK